MFHPLISTLILVSILPVPSYQQQCNPILHDVEVSISSLTSFATCNPTQNAGCTSLSRPTCDQRFQESPYVQGVSEVIPGTCTSCMAGWFLPPGPDRRLCSVDGGPNGEPAPYYMEQRSCKPCRVLSGICTEPGTTLEVCTQAGRREDARCIPCTNAPTPPPATVYTGPSVGNLNQCPYTCNEGYYLKDGTGECLTCETDACAVGFYRAGCNSTSPGSCSPCTTRESAGNSESNSIYTSSGTPFNTDTCTYECRVGYYRTYEGYCQPLGAIDIYTCPLGTRLDTGTSQCIACSGPNEVPPSNARYVLDDGSGTKGGICDWTCLDGYYRSSFACIPCTTTCPFGHYMSSGCSGGADAVCSPCDSFPPSMDAVATYRPQQKAGDYRRSSMCVWDCKTGYYRAQGDVPACARCTNKPLNAKYTQVDLSGAPADHITQCPYVCDGDTYIVVSPTGDMDVDGVNAPCDPTLPGCPVDTFCTDPFYSGPSVKSCRRSAAQGCEYASYNVERYVENVGGNPSGDWMSIASAFDGSLLYVSVNGAVYSMSTFQARELGGGTYDGAGMTLIAGAPGVSDIVDSALGINSRFYGVTSMAESSDGAKILVTDALLTSNPSRGYLRVIDVTTRNYGVSTVSSVPSTSCSSSSFLSPFSVAVMGNLAVVVDSECYTINTYDVSTGVFVTTAGTAYSQGAFDGPCVGPGAGLLDSPWGGVWDVGTGDILVLESSKLLRRISSPNTGSCTITTIASGDTLWSGAGSLVGGISLDSPGVVIVVGGNEVRTLDLSTNEYTVIAGSYQSSIDELFFGWSPGTACGSRVALPRQVLRHTAGSHGGDSAIYLVDQGNWGSGQTPSIWRLSMPCPTGWYWSGDGLCTRTLPTERCEPCSTRSATCASAIFAFDEEECVTQGSCEWCYGIAGCSAGRDRVQVPDPYHIPCDL